MTPVEFLKQNGILLAEEEDRVIMTAGGTVSLVKLLTQYHDQSGRKAAKDAPVEVTPELKPDAVVVTTTGDLDAAGSLGAIPKGVINTNEPVAEKVVTQKVSKPQSTTTKKK